MAVDIFMAYVGVYSSVEDAKADYDAVHDLHTLAGHAAAGMSRKDLEVLGEHLDAGQAGLVVVGVSDMGSKVDVAMTKDDKVEKKQVRADAAEIEKDAAADS